jgi:HEAT repeat protein
MRAGAAGALQNMLSKEPELGSRVFEPLLACLSDSNADVRANAAVSIGFIGNKQAFDRLQSLINDPARVVRARSARALGLLRDERAVEILFVVARDADDTDSSPFERIRPEAIHGLGTIGAPATDRLLTLLNTLDASTRPEIVFALGRTQDAHAAESLAALLRDEDTSIHASVWRALENIGSPALDVLVNLLNDPVEDVRNKAVRALKEIKDERAAAPLLPLLKDASPVVAASAAQALQQLDAPVSESVIELLQDPDPEVRARAVQVLGGLKDPRAVAPLTAMLNDETLVSPRKRPMNFFVSTALNLIGTPEAVEAVSRWRAAGG